MIFGKYDERARSVERAEPKLDTGKHDLRKAQPIVVEPAPHAESASAGEPPRWKD
jgi:hypothetical protein